MTRAANFTVSLVIATALVGGAAVLAHSQERPGKAPSISHLRNDPRYSPESAKSAP